MFTTWNAPVVSRRKYCLENLPMEYYRLSFLTEMNNAHLQREMDVSIAAGDIVGILYDAFLKQYGAKPTEDELKST